MISARRATLVVLLCLVQAGCASALYTRSRNRVGQAVVLVDQELLQPGATKAQLLDTLGAPRQVVALPEGDLFLYELELLDVDTFALRDPTGGPSAAFLYTTGLSHGHSLFCWFDRDGLLVEASRAVARRGR